MSEVDQPQGSGKSSRNDAAALDDPSQLPPHEPPLPAAAAKRHQQGNEPSVQSSHSAHDRGINQQVAGVASRGDPSELDFDPSSLPQGPRSQALGPTPWGPGPPGNMNGHMGSGQEDSGGRLHDMRGSDFATLTAAAAAAVGGNLDGLQVLIAAGAAGAQAAMQVRRQASMGQHSVRRSLRLKRSMECSAKISNT